MKGLCHKCLTSNVEIVNEEPVPTCTRCEMSMLEAKKKHEQPPTNS